MRNSTQGHTQHSYSLYWNNIANARILLPPSGRPNPMRTMQSTTTCACTVKYVCVRETGTEHSALGPKCYALVSTYSLTFGRVYRYICVSCSSKSQYQCTMLVRIALCSATTESIYWLDIVCSVSFSVLTHSRLFIHVNVVFGAAYIELKSTSVAASQPSHSPVRPNFKHKWCESIKLEHFCDIKSLYNVRTAFLATVATAMLTRI